MKASTDTIFITAATVLLAVIFFAGVRERVVNIPRWFADPPSSFEVIRHQAKGAQQFWIPLQLLFLIALIGAFITNWSHAGVRTMMFIGTAAFLLVIILTAVYFVKEIMYFSGLPVDAPATPDLLERANTWYQTTVSRNILQGIALIFFIVATIRSFKV